MMTTLRQKRFWLCLVLLWWLWPNLGYIIFGGQPPWLP